MPDVLRARSLADLVGVVPILLGFHPRDSLVAFCLHGPGGRIGFRLRADLPELGELTELTELLAAHLASQQPDAVVVIAFAEHAGVADEAVAALEAALARHDVDVCEAARFDGRRAYSLLCDDPGCCPPEGVPCDAATSPMLAEAVFRGVEVLPDREALERRFAPQSGPLVDEVAAAVSRERARMVRLRRELRREGRRTRRSLETELARAGAQRVRDVLDRLGARGAPGAEEIATLAVWSSLVGVRDVAWARIDRATAPDALGLWRTVATRVPQRWVVAPLCLAAFAAWLSGDGAQAQCALDRVEDLDPDCSMAALVQKALTHCLDPRSWEMPGDALGAAGVRESPRVS
ncbi:uncharacterized protein DUF4192 [Mumia flava]|uniref:Uncharacterized protein DUF4192 n=1 Tax=Mumia flava TaxID=1348852 RepID=A0A0B2BHR3_9ACTN|nr:DUF4192 domain-containing protein [Mumia flava]PJJ55954.1 uncharacterized protein DUF4192 [Mumia flava]